MGTEQLTIKYIPLSQTIPWDRNPKRHDIGGIVTSIKKHGFKDAPKFEPTLNGGQGGIVEGNGRITALSMMVQAGDDMPRGIQANGDEWLVPVAFGVDADDEHGAESYAIDHNNLTMTGGDFSDFDIAGMWDEEEYTAVLEDLAKWEELPVSVDGDALDGLLLVGKEPKKVPEPQMDIADELRQKWGTSDGQLWSLDSGNGYEHKLVCGDCTDMAVVKRVMGEERAQSLISDPPFAVRLDDWDKFKDNADFVKFMVMWLKSGKRWCSTVVTFMADKNVPLLLSAAEHIALPYRRALIWRKPPGSQFAGASLDGFWFDFEIVQVFGKPNFKPGKNTRMAVLEHRTITGQEHGCEKPIKLLEDLVLGYSQQGSIILDLFNGTGVVLMACENLFRCCRAVEISPAYVAVCLERFFLYTGQEPKLLEG